MEAQMVVWVQKLAAAGLFVIAAIIAVLVPVTPGFAQYAGDYMIQSVCVNSSDVALPLDPATCGSSGYTVRPLKVGEALPYHKYAIDGVVEQISDTFPFDAGGGVTPTRALQTYFFSTSYAADSRYGSTQPYFDQLNGGYNVLGSNGSYLSFEGTYDGSGGWQPWWTSACQTGGWLLMPSASGAVTTTLSTSTASPTDHAPDCTATPFTTASSTVQWKRISPFTYESGKQLDTLVAYHFSPGGHALEMSYLTHEYGVTRFEAWVDNLGTQVQTYAEQRCPNAPSTMTLNSTSYWLVDCRDWSNVHLLSTPWDPNSRAANDPNIIAWPIDPLYRTRNLIKEAHWGRDSSNNCQLGSNWARVNSPDVLNWAWDSTAPSSSAAQWPFTSAGNCSLIFSTPSTGGGQALYQVVPVTRHVGANTGTFGATLWAPGWSSGTNPAVIVRLFQRDASGVLLSYTDIDQTSPTAVPLSLTGKPATFGRAFTLEPNTASLTLAFYPITASTNIEITGAWVAMDPFDGIAPMARVDHKPAW